MNPTASTPIPAFSLQPSHEAQVQASLFNHGVTAADIAAAGGVGSFVQKLIDFANAHPFLKNLILNLLNKWLGSIGFPGVPTSAPKPTP